MSQTTQAIILITAHTRNQVRIYVQYADDIVFIFNKQRHNDSVSKYMDYEQGYSYRN